ncbi:MAG: hypothetical protein IH846_12235 [Acidobacteria bacterium]|nr:hypothetical protein [Acidobacteriota bacterium]
MENADRQDALAIADQLMAAQTSIEHRIMGFAAAVRMGSDDALLRLAQEIHTLRSGKMFDQLIWALQTYYQPNGNSSIPVLRPLIELRSDVPGLDVAVGKALQKIGTKEVLPTMALLLDSQDPLAKSTAAWFFHFYTAMAGPDGNINRSGDGQHPFWSDDSRRYAPRRNSNITPDEYASYWKTWWAQNRAQVGFPAP